MAGGTVHKAVCAAIVSAVPLASPSTTVLMLLANRWWCLKEKQLGFSFCRMMSGQFGELFH